MNRGSHPFDDYVSRRADQIRIARAALLFATDAYPDLSVETYLDKLERLASQVSRCRARTPSAQYRALQRTLVEAAGFQGSVDDYHDPENSYLNRVLDRKRGLPIALCAIWIDVARRQQWPVVGIGLPGHFLIRHEAMDPNVFIDPFYGGALRSKEECTALVRDILDDPTASMQHAFDAVDNACVLRRMLGNLYAHYLRISNHRRAAVVLRRMRAVVPHEILVHAELARMLTMLGEIDEAGQVLDRAERISLDGQERRLLEERREQLRGRVAELN